MKTKFTLILLTFLCFTVLAGNAQNLVLFEKTTPSTYVVNYQNNPTGQEKLTNEMLETLASGNRKSTSLTEFQFTYQVYSRITQSSADQFEAYATLKNPRMQGDVFYRGFDAAFPLLPKEVNFLLLIKNKAGNVVRQQSFLKIPLEEYPVLLVRLPFQDTTGLVEDYTLEIRDQQFFYTNQNKQQFSERVGEIDAYYATVDELDGINAELRGLSTYDLDNLVANEDRLKQLEGRLATIDRMDFPNLMPLTANSDFGQFLPKMKLARDKAAVQRTAFNTALDNYPQLRVDRGLAYVRSQNREQARIEYQKALEWDENYAPAHLELAHLAFDEGNHAEAERLARIILTNLQPDQNTRAATASLLSDLYFVYLGKAENRIKDREYSGALELLDQSLSLCQDFREVNCEQRLRNAMDTAQKGVFNRHLNQAEAHFEAEHFDAALGELNEAQKFRVERGGNFADMAREESLFQRVYAGKYAKLVEQGKKQLEMKKYAVALSSFDAAFDMEGKHNFQPELTLPGLRQQAAKPVVLGKIEEGLMQARNNFLERARQTGKQVEELVGRYGLGNDPEVSGKFEELKTQIFSQECTNAWNAYQERLQAGTGMIQQQDFIGAEIEFEGARSVLAGNQQCGLSDQEAAENLERIREAAEYQKRMQEIDSKVNRSLHSQVLQDLGEAAQYFRTNQLDRFGLKHPSKEEYISKSGSKGLHFAGAQYFAQQKQPEVALEMLRKLSAWNYPKGKTKTLQKELGAQLATRDHALDPNADPKSKAEQYVMGNKWLKWVRKGYKKQWKRLD